MGIHCGDLQFRNWRSQHFKFCLQRLEFSWLIRLEIIMSDFLKQLSVYIFMIRLQQALGIELNVVWLPLFLAACKLYIIRLHSLQI